MSCRRQESLSLPLLALVLLHILHIFIQSPIRRTILELDVDRAALPCKSAHADSRRRLSNIRRTFRKLIKKIEVARVSRTRGQAGQRSVLHSEVRHAGDLSRRCWMLLMRISLAWVELPESRRRRPAAPCPDTYGKFTSTAFERGLRGDSSATVCPYPACHLEGRL